MGIGGSIFLIAIGAILAFAVHASLGFVSIQVVGWVLMVAGVLALILTLYFWNNRRRTVVTTAMPPQDRAIPSQDRRVVEERREVERYPGEY